MNKMPMKIISIKSIPKFISSYAVLIAVGIAVLSLMNLIIQYIYFWQPDIVASQLMIGLAAAIAPLTVRSNERKISLLASIFLDISTESQQKIALGNEIKKIDSNMAMNVFPLAITLLGLFSLIIFGSPWRGQNASAHSVFSIFVIVFFLVTGSLGWQYISLINILLTASKIDVKASIFTWPARQIKKINRITIEIYLAGVLVYIGAIFAVWALPWGQFLLTNDNLFTRLWVFPIALIVIGYFLAIQYLIHRLLATLKDVRLEKIDRKLEELSDEKHGAALDENIKLINELINWRKIVDAESEWPLNIQTFVGVIGGVLLPTIASISDLLLKFFR